MKTAIGYPSPWKLLALAALPALVVGLALMLALVVTSGTAADELNQMDTFMQAPVDGCMTANPMFAVAPSTGLDV